MNTKCHSQRSLLGISLVRFRKKVIGHLLNTGNKQVEDPGDMRTATSGMTPSLNNRAFTLIELLVVVLIIGILAAVALPQYQKAVLKSRYSGLMPIASAVANGQEIYYMDKGHYSTDITQLDIKAPSGGANAEIEVNDGSDERFDYVLATRTDAPGVAYVMYQKHSAQFPDTIMCEANDTLNSQATWLCKEALKGEEVTSGSLQGTGWTAYLLKGTEGSNTFADPGGCTGEKPDDIVASQSGAKGTAVCNAQTGTWQYVWSEGKTYTARGAACEADEAYACAGGVFQRDDPHTVCDSRVENGCTGAAISNNGICSGSVANACAGAIISDGGFCQGSTNSCAGAIFTGTGCCFSGCVAGQPKCAMHQQSIPYPPWETSVYDGGWDGESYW